MEEVSAEGVWARGYIFWWMEWMCEGSSREELAEDKTMKTELLWFMESERENPGRSLTVHKPKSNLLCRSV